MGSGADPLSLIHIVPGTSQTCTEELQYPTMKNISYKFIPLLFILLLSLSAAPVQAQTQQPIVHAVMFWMSGCPHCESVIQNVLPPLNEKYGEQFDLLMIEVKGTADVDILLKIAASYGIPKENTGVPFLIIGDQVLVGSDQVQNQLPGLVADHLAGGGLGFPTNPLLAGLLPIAALPSDSTSTSTSEPAVAVQTVPTLKPELALENETPVESTPELPVKNNGFTLAAIVMAFMVLASIYSFGSLLIGKLYIRAAWMDAAIPWLSLVGLAVAAYLIVVETQSVKAFCGPVGDCNAVQSSSYSRLWGILPVGVLGALGYIGIFAAWWSGRQHWGWLSTYAPVALFGMALFGTIFSIYLTYLEIFVIGAVCIWCISSAIIITLLLLASLNSALGAFSSGTEEEDLE